MHVSLKNILSSNILLKIISLILGSILWLILSQSHVVRRWFTVPIYFYNVPAGSTVVAPEEIDVQLTGTRTELTNIDLEALALHINADELADGKNRVALETAHLLLPERIKLINYCPANFCVEITATEQSV